MVRQNLKETGQAFDFVEFEQHYSLLGDTSELAREVVRPNAVAIFWYEPPDYEIVKGMARGTGWTVASDPAIWVHGERANASSYHTAYKPFLVGTASKEPVWKHASIRGNVFYHPNYGNTRPTRPLMKSILQCFAKRRVLIPNATRGSTVLACLDLGFIPTAWGGQKVRDEVEKEWGMTLARMDQAAQKAKV